MKNGKWRCKAWNEGQCSSKEGGGPKKQRHLCSVAIREDDRVCGIHDHHAFEHEQGGRSRSNRLGTWGKGNPPEKQTARRAKAR